MPTTPSSTPIRSADRSAARALEPDEVAGAAARLENAAPQEIVAWAMRRHPRGRIAVVTGLQAEGVVIADMAIAIDPQVRIVTIDSGRLPEASQAYIDVLRERWGRSIEVHSPDPAEVGEFVAEHGQNSFYRSPQRRLDCCHVRKVAPLDRILAGLDCWMVGLRRGQTAGRAGLRGIALDPEHGGMLKVSPMAGWDAARVRAELATRGLPIHPLYAEGFASIGCAPCTRPIGPGEDERAGRWWWESGIDKECGIHGRPGSGKAAAPPPGA